MDYPAKAIIRMNEGILELEGSEAFVVKYLEEYKSYFDAHFRQKDNFANENTKTIEPTTARFKSTKNKKESRPTKAKPKKVKDFAPEKFDIYPKGKSSLQDFFNEKKPGDSSKERILVVAYYIKNTLNLPSFTEGNIEYVYRTLKLGNKPIHLRQTLTDIKNKDSRLEQLAEGWVINRVGEKFVDEQLPKKVSPVS